MKYIAAGISLALICTCGFGATTCLHNRTAVAVIQKSVDPVSSSYNASNMTFTLTMNYDVIPGKTSRTIDGIATCNEIETDTSDAAAKLGSANTHLRASTADVGTRCWCSLTRPVSSWWVYYKVFGTEEECAAGCARDCAAAIRENTSNYRTNGIYMAIW